MFPDSLAQSEVQASHGKRDPRQLNQPTFLPFVGCHKCFKLNVNNRQPITSTFNASRLYPAAPMMPMAHGRIDTAVDIPIVCRQISNITFRMLTTSYCLAVRLLPFLELPVCYKFSTSEFSGPGSPRVRNTPSLMRSLAPRTIFI